MTKLLLRWGISCVLVFGLALILVVECEAKQKTTAKTGDTLVVSFHIFKKPSNLEKTKPEFHNINYTRFDVIGVIRDLFSLSNQSTAEESWFETNRCKFDLDDKSYQVSVRSTVLNQKQKDKDIYLSAGQIVYDSKAPGWASFFYTTINPDHSGQGGFSSVEPEYYIFDAMLIGSEEVTEQIKHTRQLYSSEGQIVKYVEMSCKKEKTKFGRK